MPVNDLKDFLKSIGKDIANMKDVSWQDFYGELRGLRGRHTSVPHRPAPSPPPSAPSAELMQNLESPAAMEQDMKLVRAFQVLDTLMYDGHMRGYLKLDDCRNYLLKVPCLLAAVDALRLPLASSLGELCCIARSLLRVQCGAAPMTVEEFDAFVEEVKTFDKLQASTVTIPDGCRCGWRGWRGHGGSWLMEPGWLEASSSVQCCSCRSALKTARSSSTRSSPRGPRRP